MVLKKIVDINYTYVGNIQRLSETSRLPQNSTKINIPREKNSNLYVASQSKVGLLLQKVRITVMWA